MITTLLNHFDRLAKGFPILFVVFSATAFATIFGDSDLVSGQEAQAFDADAEKPKWISGTPTQLTFDGRLKNDPVFVNRGNSIVYTSLEKFNQLCLMQIDIKVGTKPAAPKRYRPSASTSELMISFAQDENRFAYLRNNGNLHFEIVLENRQTGKSVSYNPGGGFAGVRNVSYAPDGSQVIFAFPDQNGPQQIKSLGADGKSVSLLTNSEGINRCPKYSNDGKRIVFASSRDGDFDIFTMNSNGSNPTNVTKSKGLDTHPAFSPDGRQIAFTGLRNGNYDIYLINSDGSNLRRLTKSEETDDYPAWSPDGKTVVWVGERKGKRDLYAKALGSKSDPAKKVTE